MAGQVEVQPARRRRAAPAGWRCSGTATTSTPPSASSLAAARTAEAGIGRCSRECQKIDSRPAAVPLHGLDGLVAHVGAVSSPLQADRLAAPRAEGVEQRALASADVQHGSRGSDLVHTSREQALLRPSSASPRNENLRSPAGRYQSPYAASSSLSVGAGVVVRAPQHPQRARRGGNRSAPSSEAPHQAQAAVLFTGACMQTAIRSRAASRSVRRSSKSSGTMAAASGSASARLRRSSAS